ncbi:MAG: hypothetical protein IT306_29200 [Chloroflexi bacterium]|nr:hypothetical protein [Chloroflexota bacterium]
MPNRQVSITVSIDRWKELSAKLKSDELLAGPWTAAMQQVASIGLRAWQGASPVASGRMRASMKSKVQAKPVPRWVAFRTSATRSSKRYKRYRYPGRQEYDPKSRNKGRLKKALDGVMGQIQGVLGTAAKAIEAKWRA